jgi:16S rRNA (guanine527-N7)-methyltransferase
MTPSSPPTPMVASAVFGDRVGLAEAYVDLLADTGISHGLIGPREAPRLWDRHVLNCAVAHPVFSEGTRVADIGSGAGLPGIPLAIARPDLRLVLVEPLLRRTAWLTTTVASLGLTNVEIHRGRAESLWGTDRFHHVTARAVARTGELARICLPLLQSGGSLVALKGEGAVTELEEDGDQLRSMGASRWEVARFGDGLVDPETVVVTVHVDHAVNPPGEGARGGPRARRGRPARREPVRKGPDGRRSDDH